MPPLYDALTTRRVYKEPWPLAKAEEYIIAQSAAQFDPRVVAAFRTVIDQFASVASGQGAGVSEIASLTRPGDSSWK